MQTWLEGQVIILQLKANSYGRRLRALGGLDFANQISALSFDLASNTAQNVLSMMRFYDRTQNDEVLPRLAGSLFEYIDDARERSIGFWPECIWTPSPQQEAKLFLREAVASRLIKDFDRADHAIDQALVATPNDVELQKEKTRIYQARGHDGGV